ncbi:MAG TPA: peptidyl-prolyl cis-trans isomerase [Asticcacaulis sp.]|nr:peptidyl-prolyl cis-trans isomerase [Asticcacaulis sp.]
MAQRSGAGLWKIAPVMLAMVLGLTACNKTQEAERPPEPGDIAVARVDGETIWSSDVRNEAVAQGQIGPGEPLDMTSDLFSRTLGEVIDQRLLAKAARTKGLDKSISAQRRLQAATDRILGDMLVESSIDRNIDERAVKAQYDEQVKLSKQSEEIRARIIVTKSQADAQALLKQVQTGGLFEALAMERSIDQATRFNGGDMGYVTTDILPQNFKTVLMTAKVGDTVGPVQAEGGWAILRVEDRRPEQMPTLEEERPIIMRYLIYNQVAGLLKDLEDHSKVERLLPKSARKDSEMPPATAAPGAFDASAQANDAADTVSDATAASSASSSSAPAAKPAAKDAESKAKPAASTSPILPGIPDPTRGHHLFAPAKAPKG